MADFHLDFFQYMLKKRRDDFSNALFSCMNTILKENQNKKIDFVCISGDVFHGKHPSWKAIEEFQYFINVLNTNGIKVIGVTGNHDHTPYTWMEFFQVFGGSAPIVHFDNVVIYKVNWSVSMIDQCFDIVKNVNKDKFNILIVHQGTDKYFGKLTELAIDRFSALGINYIALGHIHVPYSYSIAHNPGSLEYTSSTDWGNPGGIFVVDVLDGVVSIEHVLSQHRHCFKVECRGSVKSLYKTIADAKLSQDSMLEVDFQSDIKPKQLNDLEMRIKEDFALLRVKIKNNVEAGVESTSEKLLSEEDVFEDVFKDMSKVVKEVVVNRDSPEKVAELLDDH